MNPQIDYTITKQNGTRVISGPSSFVRALETKNENALMYWYLQNQPQICYDEKAVRTMARNQILSTMKSRDRRTFKKQTEIAAGFSDRKSLNSSNNIGQCKPPLRKRR